LLGSKVSECGFGVEKIVEDSVIVIYLDSAADAQFADNNEGVGR
jgi:hypothetical protein